MLALVVCLLVQLAMPIGALAAGSTYSLVDIVQLARALTGATSLTQAQQVRYDLNADGRVNILDLSLIADAVLAATTQGTQNTTLAQRVVCDTCHQYPCVCHNVPAAAAQPTVCPNCAHYPCTCTAAAVQPHPTVCGTCHHYPCTCRSTSSGSTSTWTCGTCHQYPCVCSGSGHHAAAGGGHHGHGHH